MAIDMKGQLDGKSLTEIFAILNEQDNACSLLVSDGVSEKIFYFSIGGLRLVSLGGREGMPLGEILVRDEMLTPARREKVAARAKETSKKFSDAAKDLGYITQEQLSEALRNQVEAELCDLFLWEGAEYEFTDGQPPQQFYDSRHRACSVSVDIPEFIRGVEERRARFERVRKQIPSDREIFDPTDRGREIQLLDAEDAISRILTFVDGARRVREVIDESGFTALTTYECLYTLLEEGLIQTSKSGAGQRKLGRDEILAEIEKLEKSRTEVMGDLILRVRLAKAYESITENAKAARIWREIAQLHRRKNDLRRCLECLRHAARCEPQNFEVREQILEVHRALKDHGAFLEEGRALAESLLKHNLMNRARKLLDDLVKMAPEDARIRKLYALVLLGMGEEQLALHQLLELARILEQNGGSEAELKEVYRRILALDKGNRKVRQRLLALSGTRRAIWISRLVIGAAAVVLMLAGGAFFYERAARKSYEEGTGIEELLGSRDFRGARERVEEIRDSYPLSSVARSAADWLNRIDAYEADYLKRGLLADVSRARLARRQGNYLLADKIFSQTVHIDPGQSPEARTAVEEAVRYMDRETEARRRANDAESFVAAGDYGRALRAMSALNEDLPDTRAVAEMLWPTEIDSVPAGARVFVDGVEVGATPYRFRYSLLTKPRIEVEHPGFTPVRLDVEEPLAEKVMVHLRREALWTFAGDGPFESSPVLADGTLYVTGRDRYFYAIDARDGRLKYRVCLGIFGDTSSSPVVLGGIAVVGTSRGELVGLETSMGRRIWSRSFGSPIAADVAADRANALVYVTLVDGLVVAVNPEDGTELWSRSARAAPSSGPALAPSLVFVGSYDRRRLLAIDAGEGRELWDVSADGPVAGPPAVADDYVCFGSDDQHVYAVNWKTQAPFGAYRAQGMVKSRPAVRDRTILFGSMSGSFHCYPLTESGEGSWVRELGAPILAEAGVDDHNAYVGTTAGDLYCLDRRTGATEWIFETDGKIVSRPLVTEDAIYLTSMDGKIYAIRR